jgi:hypothetical protein
LCFLQFAFPSFRFPSLTSNIHHIQLLRLFSQKSPFSLDSKKNQQEKRLSSHHVVARENSKPSIWDICWICVWSRVMLLQFPSGRFFFFLHYCASFFCAHSSSPPSSNRKGKIVYFLDILSALFFPSLYIVSHSVPKFSFVSEWMFFLRCSLDPRKNSGIME